MPGTGPTHRGPAHRVHGHAAKHHKYVLMRMHLADVVQTVTIWLCVGREYPGARQLTVRAEGVCGRKPTASAP